MAWKAYNALMDDPRLLVLDARSPHLYAAAHIRGSVCVALSPPPPPPPQPQRAHTLERLEGPGPPTWSANCWWDRNILLILPSSSSSFSSSNKGSPSPSDSAKSSRKRKASDVGNKSMSRSDPVLRFLMKEGLVRSLKILEHDREDEDPFSAFCTSYPFLVTRSCKPASVSGYPTEIVPGLLYLGDQDHAAAENRLNDLLISHVLTIHTEPIKLKRHFVHMFCDLSDEPHADISKYFEPMFEYVEEARKSGGRVLVHCGAGASRSATLCVYYLMRLNRWTLEETLKFMRAQRKQVQPNPGFLAQLTKYEDLLGIKSIQITTLPSSRPRSQSDHNRSTEMKVAATTQEGGHMYFEVFKDGQCVDVVHLISRRRLIFGRLGACDVLLGHASTSRQHAQLELGEASEIRLVDLDSVHGTFVNGKRLLKNNHCVLSIGDTIQFGASTKKYVLTFGRAVA